MPVFPLGKTNLHFFLICLNAKGEEQAEADGDPPMSAQLAARLARRTNPVTDVFIVCHGWNTSAADAHKSYIRWMSAMADDSADIRRAAEVYGGTGGDAFNPLLIGVQWPSKFGDTSGATLPAAVLAAAVDTPAAGTPVAAASAAAAVAAAGGAGDDAAAVAAVGAQANALAAALDGADAARVQGALTTLAASVVVPETAAQVVTAASAAAGRVAPGAAGGGGGGGGRVATAVAALDTGAPATAGGGGADGADDDAALPAATIAALAELGAALEPLSEDEDGGATGGTDDGARAAAAFRLEAAAAAAEEAAASSSRPTAADVATAAPIAASASAPSSGGTLFAPLRLLLSPLSDVVFAAFQRRAAHLGRTAVHNLVASLMTAAGEDRTRTGAVRFHAIGHSLGAHMVCGTALGPRGGTSTLPARLHSAALIQAAVPTAAFRPGGAYRRLVAPGPHRPVAGAVTVTYSPSDRALAHYTLMYGPPLGSVGADKDLSPSVPARHAVMDDAVQSYNLAPGELLSVDSKKFVDEGAGGLWDVVGSHMDITDDPVSHLVWEAVLTKVPSKEYVAVPPPCTPARASGGDDKGWGMGQAVGGAALATSRAIGGVVGGTVGGASRIVGGVVGGGAAAVSATAGGVWGALRWALPPY